MSITTKTGLRVPNDQNALVKVLMYILMRVFLAAWFVDIVYDVFAPVDFPHFTYWTALWMTMLFHIVVGSLRKEGSSV